LCFTVAVAAFGAIRIFPAIASDADIAVRTALAGLAAGSCVGPGAGSFAQRVAAHVVAAADAGCTGVTALAARVVASNAQAAVRLAQAGAAGHALSVDATHVQAVIGWYRRASGDALAACLLPTVAVANFGAVAVDPTIAADADVALGAAFSGLAADSGVVFGARSRAIGVAALAVAAADRSFAGCVAFTACVIARHAQTAVAAAQARAAGYVRALAAAIVQPIRWHSRTGCDECATPALAAIAVIALSAIDVEPTAIVTFWDANARACARTRLAELRGVVLAAWTLTDVVAAHVVRAANLGQTGFCGFTRRTVQRNAAL
jgi:hypothetical protein